jgi:hypothetical protein
MIIRITLLTTRQEPTTLEKPQGRTAGDGPVPAGWKAVPTCPDGGITCYLEVSMSQSGALSDEVAAVNILGRRMTSAVLLIQALGGGWDRPSLPERPECCGPLTSAVLR